MWVLPGDCTQVTAKQLSYLVCDGCGKTSVAKDLSAESLRRRMRKMGWHYNRTTKWVARWGGPDICSDCYQKGGGRPWGNGVPKIGSANGTSSRRQGQGQRLPLR